MTKSEQLFEAARRVIPGGVNSPVRAFGAVGEVPRFVEQASGSHIMDADGNRYIDYVGSWGPMILGHSHPAVLEAVTTAAQRGLSFGAATAAEVEMAELMCSMVPSLQMVRMVNSGTEAVMSAIRAARGYTGRDKIIKFEGCYHGHCDALLVKAGSGLMTSGQPGSAGVPIGCTQDTLTAVYNDISSVELLFAANKGEIAALIIEPVAANMGVVLPEEGFLPKLRELCTANGTVLIFDEVITGFRLAPGGAQERFGVQADLTAFGKIIGGGMPVGAYGGKREIMQQIAPCGSVYQAGTLSGNPVAMAAGICQLSWLREHPEVYQKLDALGRRLRSGLQTIIVRTGAPCSVTGIGSLSCLFFTKGPVRNYEEAKASDTALFASYFRHMLKGGVYLAPSQFEAIFLSDAHTEEEIVATLACAEAFFSREANL